ncbi:hypothetical protein MRX96_031991 [Rhipicephalus microplus]
MERIFHEKQEGSLCAQHCLNGLLQGEYFTAVDLATIAQQIDEQERETMAEGGPEQRRLPAFRASALMQWRRQPKQILRSRRPTYAITRTTGSPSAKLGSRWFNLNSLLSGPQPISRTYLALFLAQLQQEGYSIFVVVGELPQCQADDFHEEDSDPDLQEALQQSLQESQQAKTPTEASTLSDDEMLEAALRLSMES